MRVVRPPQPRRTSYVVSWNVKQSKVSHRGLCSVLEKSGTATFALYSFGPER